MKARIAVIMALAVIVATVVLIPSRQSLRVSSDSIHYYSVADNLGKGYGPRTFNGVTSFVHPFGYSLALAPLLSLGVPIHWAALIVNWLSIVAVFVFAWLILRRWAGDGWRAITAAATVAFTPSLFTYSNTMLSEPLFCAGVMGFLWVAVRMAQGANGH